MHPPREPHVPVLAGPSIDWLRVREDGIYVDCTVGAGGHAARIAERAPRGKLVAMDRDPAAAALAEKKLAGYANVTVLHRNYAELAGVLEELGIESVDGVLVDAGLSSIQLDDPSRGFSYQQEGPLDMRMDTTRGVTAGALLGHVDEGDLVRILKDYGDVRPARRVARAILERRREGALRTTGDLRAAVGEALNFVRGTPEETRTVFQALRIAVNDELGCLEKAMREAIAALGPGGRLVAITFHSGEDRIVKRIMREAARRKRELHPDGRVKAVLEPCVRLLTPKPIEPDEEERRANPRSHSAKLRAVERLAAREEDS